MAPSLGSTRVGGMGAHTHNCWIHSSLWRGSQLLKRRAFHHFRWIPLIKTTENYEEVRYSFDPQVDIYWSNVGVGPRNALWRLVAPLCLSLRLSFSPLQARRTGCSLYPVAILLGSSSFAWCSEKTLLFQKLIYNKVTKCTAHRNLHFPVPIMNHCLLWPHK